VLVEEVPQDGQERDGSAACFRPRADRPLVLIPAALDLDHARTEINISPAKRL
jgi:hypothetical protein